MNPAMVDIVVEILVALRLNATTVFEAIQAHRVQRQLTDLIDQLPLVQRDTVRQRAQRLADEVHGTKASSWWVQALEALARSLEVLPSPKPSPLPGFTDALVNSQQQKKEAASSTGTDQPNDLILDDIILEFYLLLRLTGDTILDQDGATQLLEWLGGELQRLPRSEQIVLVEYATRKALIEEQSSGRSERMLYLLTLDADLGLTEFEQSGNSAESLFRLE